jgi:elongin-A
MAPSSSLVAMAQRAAVRDIAGLQDIGDMDYDLVRPILRKITNPEQLRKLEVNSPHITDHDSELWRAFIARDIPQWEQKIMEPKNPRSWWKVYAKLMRREKRAKEEQEEQLMAAMKGLDQQKEANQVTHVRKVLHEPTRYRPLFADGIPNPYVNSNGAVKRPVLKNAKNGKDILYALRKQTVNASKEKGLVALPARAFVRSAKSQIAKAPEAMVREHQRPQLTAAARQMANERTSNPIPRAFVTKAGPSATDRAINDAVRQEREKKEDRLRALASGKSSMPLSPPTSQPRSIAGSSQSTARPAASSPPKAMSPAPSASPAADLKPGGRTRIMGSPSPVPPLIKKRPASSIFMPAKKRKV